MAAWSSSKPTLRHTDYTIGWVCALPKEQTAALAMLDKIHQDLTNPPNDQNTYILGSIHEHNVAIACLPMGRIGTTSAASVVTSMINTFPSIRFGLMVGIGGGIPPKVRLGDVVISIPTGSYPGVVQWDMGKAKSQNTFERIGALNSPPNILLSAVGKLQSLHTAMGTMIPQYLDDMRKNWPNLVPKYLKSDSMQDILFKAGYEHVQPPDDDESDIEDSNCRLCNTMEIITRRPREMKIFHGTIASGNQVIKDGAFRDGLNKSLGGQVLCVEMEAAGLMNNFPCLVIRGICDYADSHKNKNWQEYAAIVAAAYAKELLGLIQPKNLAEEPLLKKGVKVLTNKMNRRVRSTIVSWLSNQIYRQEQDTFYKKCQPGTGQWFLGTEEYRTWIDVPGQTLFCPGIPGSGKTILTSIIINDICTEQMCNDRAVGVAYVYFNYNLKNEHDSHQVLASLLGQLVKTQATIPKFIRNLYKKHRRLETKLSTSDVQATFRSVVSLYSRVFLVFDALDECQRSEAQHLLSYLFELQLETSINIMATSRSVAEITQFFEREGVRRLEISARQSDVKQYLEGHISRLPFVVRRDTLLQEMIITRISDSVDGMFLLAQIYLDSLEDKLTTYAIETELRRFERQKATLEGNKTSLLSKAYDGTMMRINSQLPGSKDLATKVLSWLSYARRRLTLSELVVALTVSAGDKELNAKKAPAIEDILTVCAGLAAREADGSVQFVHYTTQEYFLETRNTCLAYLSFDVFETGYCDNSYQFFQRRESYPFYDYAAKFWGYHINPSESSNVAVTSCQALPLFKADPSWMEDDETGFPYKATGLHLAVIFQLEKSIHYLLDESGYNADPFDGHNATPLSYAARLGHVGITKVLLEKGADPNTKDHGEWTPLLYSAFKGHDIIVDHLLQMGASTEALDKFGRRPLHYAVDGDHGNVVKQLFANGANANITDYHGRTALLVAVELSLTDMVQCLLEHGADVNQADAFGQTPLSLSIRKGDEKMTKLLTERGASLAASRESYVLAEVLV
ncbi:hypothetical protein F4777DRAFT_589005 [Nemania sp. FL0916]|nr:hypothetical protein F4777DRAFT_589005 [Nemania sp. FL0916]